MYVVIDELKRKWILGISLGLEVSVLLREGDKAKELIKYFDRTEWRW